MINFLSKKFFCVYILILVLVDFLSKYFATIYLKTTWIDLFWWFFYFHLYLNAWIAFSLYVPFLKILTLIIIILLIFYYFKFEINKKNSLIDLSFILILSWALWNAWERIFLWRVTDFIWIKYFSVFNFSDAYISIWIFIYFLLVLLKKDK